MSTSPTTSPATTPPPPVIPEPKDYKMQESARICSGWEYERTSKWDFLHIFEARKRIEVSFNREGDLQNIQIVRQEASDRFLSWIEGIFHLPKKTHTTLVTELKDLNPDPRTAEIWKRAYESCGAQKCSAILDKDLKPLLNRDLTVIKEGLNHSVMLDLYREIIPIIREKQKIKDDIDRYSENLAPFDESIEKEWNQFKEQINVKLAYPKADLQAIKKEIILKKEEIFESCRKQALEEIDIVLQQGDIETGKTGIPPFRTRFSRYAQHNIGIKDLVDRREKMWENLQKGLNSADNFKDLTIAMDIISSEQVVDDILYEAVSTVSKHITKGIPGCMELIQKKALELLRTVDLTITDLNSPEAIRSVVGNYYKNRHTLTDKDKSTVEDLRCYVRCMMYIQNNTISQFIKETPVPEAVEDASVPESVELTFPRILENEQADIYKKYEIVPLPKLLESEKISEKFSKHWEKIKAFVGKLEEDRHNTLKKMMLLGPEEYEEAVIRFAEAQKGLNVIVQDVLESQQQLEMSADDFVFACIDKGIEYARLDHDNAEMRRIGDEYHDHPITISDFTLKQLKDMAVSMIEQEQNEYSLKFLQQFKQDVGAIDILVKMIGKDIGDRTMALMGNMENLKSTPDFASELASTQLQALKADAQAPSDIVNQAAIAASTTRETHETDMVELEDMRLQLIGKENPEEMSLSKLIDFFSDSRRQLNLTEGAFAKKQRQITRTSDNIKQHVLSMMSKQIEAAKKELEGQLKSSPTNMKLLGKWEGADSALLKLKKAVEDAAKHPESYTVDKHKALQAEINKTISSSKTALQQPL